MRVVGLLVLSGFLLFAEGRTPPVRQPRQAAADTAAQGSAPRRDVHHILFNPQPEDWASIANPEQVTILRAYNGMGCKPPVSDDSLANLRRFPQLRTLVLSCPQVTDEGLKHILALKQLSGLVFYSCDLTDDGIQQLQHLPSLRTVGFLYMDVSDGGTSRISAAGIRRLQDAMPHTYVEHRTFGRSGRIFEESGRLTTKFQVQHLGMRSGP